MNPLHTLDESERFDYISTNLENKHGSDLGNFISYLELSEIDSKPYDKLFMKKLKTAKYPYDIMLLTNILLKNENNKTEIEDILNDKIEIWDSDNWAENFWLLIKEYDLKVQHPNYYTIKDSTTSKHYDIFKFLKSKNDNGELGENPLLMVDSKIIDYSQGKLIETLRELDIKQIDYIPKVKSTSLHGKRGTDGFLKISTK